MCPLRPHTVHELAARVGYRTGLAGLQYAGELVKHIAEARANQFLRHLVAMRIRGVVQRQVGLFRPYLVVATEVHGATVERIDRIRLILFEWWN